MEGRTEDEERKGQKEKGGGRVRGEGLRGEI